MNEELNIKIKVDTSAITPAVNKLKNEVSNVNKSVNSSTSVNSQVKTTEQLSKTLNKVRNSVNNIKSGISGWDVLGAITGAKALNSIFDGAKKSVKELGKMINNSSIGGNLANTFSSLNPFSKMYKEDIEWTGWKDALEYAKINFSEFKFELRSSVKNFTERINNDFKSIGNAKNLKQLSAGFKSLGFTLKNATIGSKGFKAALLVLKSVALWTAIAIAGVLATFASIGTIGAAAALKVSKLGSEIYHSAQQFGFSTKAYQEWGYIMERNGSSIEDLKGFLETLNSEQGAVMTGSEEAAQKFRNLGISAEEAVSMDSQTLFETTIAKLQGIEDATLRSSYAYEMFGDEASRLMNVINMSNAEMQQTIEQYNLLGGSMSQSLIEQSNSLQNSIANMKQAWQGISNTLAEVFIPVVRAVVNWLTKAFVIINLFLRTIFGLDLKTKSASKGVDKATASNNRYTGSLGAAKKAVEELKRVTLGFDELNIVNNPKSSGANSGGGVGSLDMSDVPTIDDSLLNTDDLNLDGIYEWFEEYKGLIAQIVTWSLIGIGALLMFIGALTLNIPLFILGAGMVGLGITIGIKSGAFKELAEGIKKIGRDLKLWFEREILPMFTKEYWENLWDNIKWATAEALKGLWRDINRDWESIKKWFMQNIAPMFTKKYWENLWDNIKWATANALIGILRDINRGWKSIKDWFKQNVIPIFTAAYWKEKFNSLPDGMKSAINGLMGIVERGVNFIIRQMNKLSWKVPDWVPGVGGNKWGFNLNYIKIPRLATGGIATRSTLANIGEAGKEAVLPLEYNTEWMDTLADKIAARNGGGPTKIVLKVGEKELGWATIDSINSITKQTGAIQLTL